MPQSEVRSVDGVGFKEKKEKEEKEEPPRQSL
jgi:hypothetical protein